MTDIEYSEAYQAGWGAGYKAGFIKGQTTPVEIVREVARVPMFEARRMSILPERPS